MQTPTDLTSYANLARSEPQPEAVMQVPQAAQAAQIAQAGGGRMQVPITLNRRPGLELSLPLANGGGVAGGLEDGSLDLSALDVPAFLRRQN